MGSSVSYVPFDASQIPGGGGGGGGTVSTAKRVDDQTTHMFVATAVPGTNPSTSLWAIKKITFSGTLINIQWANGVSTANQIWDNRAALSYS